MSDRSNKAEEILDVAERMARTGGYNGFSFREIAKQVGIKAASVHYHFPGKEELGVAVARRYTDRFLAALGEPDDPGVTPEALMRRYIDAYRRSLVDDGLMCLCGMFGAEIAYLPRPVADEAKRFFESNISWLTSVIERLSDRGERILVSDKAVQIIATLEGALIVARSLDDPAAFDAATMSITLH